METIPPEQKTQIYWENYFREHGVRPEQGAKFWQKQEQCLWRTKFPIHESAQRWIDNATPDERLPPEKHWKPFGRTEAEQRVCAQDALLRERSTPGTYSPSELRDIHAFLNLTTSNNVNNIKQHQTT